MELERRAVSRTILIMLLIGMLTLTFNIRTAKAEPRTWTVDDDGPADFNTIQEAIDAASDGDTIYVRVGIYNESPLAYRKDNITLIGESCLNTVVNGSLQSAYAVNTSVMNFDIRGDIKVQYYSWGARGIYICNNIVHEGIGLTARYSAVRNNVIRGGLTLRTTHVFSPKLNLIENNTLLDCGIVMENPSRYNVITRNAIINASTGIRETGGHVWYHSSYNNSITDNQLIECGIGVKISRYFGLGTVYSGSIISGNTFERNGYAIILEKSTNVSIHHNNFLNNKIQAYVNQSYNNSWDDGYPSGGNYWSDYTDVDLYNGPDQDVFGVDGIWDHPYTIDASNRDTYPLVKPWPIVPVTLDIEPDVLTCRSKRRWITAYIQLPERYNATDIDASTILLNKAIPPILDPKYGFVTCPSEYLVDHDSDGILERVVKFDISEVMAHINFGEVTLTMTGEFNGIPFEGSDTVRVIEE